MLRSEFKSVLLGKGILILRILWAAIIMSILLFGLVLTIVQPPVTESDALVLPLYAVAVSVGALAIGVRFLSPERLGSRTTPNALDAIFQLKPEGEAEAGAVRIYRGIQTRCVLGYALSEAVSLFGFVLSFLTGEMMHYLVLGGAGLGLMVVVHFPSRAPLEDALSKLQ